MPWFEAKNLRKRFLVGESEVTVLDDFSLAVERGDFVVIVGRSGSGKTTLMRILCGLLAQDSGSVLLEGEPVQVGRISMVFQEPRLMPWLSVEENILFAHLPKVSRQQREEAGRIMEMLGLLRFRRAYPWQLSGGMAGRVALGRVLSHGPELILMDEPLSALDYFTRAALRDEILRLHDGGKTIIFVTHDIAEAVTLASRVIVIDEGHLLRELPVDMAYPRERTNPRFGQIEDEILRMLSRESTQREELSSANSKR